ncbi:hypothetical protein CKM354_000041100 [Cercospora kikuchii]|uniref:Uncharacterized protein n=1 Tax=Cercospora kikuchii TaxID=84275 RepID=A0A9P3F773_9PEZI|nr:uncharacterized protein CKM354_000041100 [Cercospora kikuchii]GIZ36946.1 hypothetical protein CKM354_000041100 [Cercospora kikuchii]
MKYNTICAITTVVIGASAAPVADPILPVQHFQWQKSHPKAGEAVLDEKRDAVFVGQYDDPRKQGSFGLFRNHLQGLQNEKRRVISIDQLPRFSDNYKNWLGIGPQINERSADKDYLTINVDQLPKFSGNKDFLGIGPQISARDAANSLYDALSRYGFGLEDVKRDLDLSHFRDHFPQDTIIGTAQNPKWILPGEKRNAEAEAEPIVRLPGMPLVNTQECNDPLLCASLKAKREPEAEPFMHIPGTPFLENCKSPWCVALKAKREAEADPILRLPGMPSINPENCNSPLCASLKQKREAEAEALLWIPGMPAGGPGCRGPTCESWKQ